MKPIKMLGLATLAALMAMAFVGATSASASSTLLCSTDPASSCTKVTHVHESTLEGVPAILKTNIFTFECDVLFLSTEVGALGTPQTITGTFSYSNCTNNCTAAEETPPSTIKVLKTGHETAFVTGEGVIHVNCSGANCYYDGKGLEGTGVGALLSEEENGEVAIEGQEVHANKGLFCPKEAVLTVVTTPLSATYIGS